MLENDGLGCLQQAVGTVLVGALVLVGLYLALGGPGQQPSAPARLTFSQPSPRPTAIPAPTSAPPQPSPTPWPTQPPAPTYTARPTYTPWPTPAGPQASPLEAGPLATAPPSPLASGALAGPTPWSILGWVALAILPMAAAVGGGLWAWRMVTLTRAQAASLQESGPPARPPAAAPDPAGPSAGGNAGPPAVAGEDLGPDPGDDIGPTVSMSDYL